jgi:glycosyltransferase involved in cell wall biosynthesis
MTETLMKHYQSFPKPIPQLLHLPMTADLERFQGQIEVHQDFDQPYIAFVGVMGNAKDGVNILIEAFNNIHEKYPDLKIYLVGGWIYDTLSHLKRIKELNSKERIKWVGSYPRLAIPSIICNARILALPRPDSKQAQGGFPTKLLYNFLQQLYNENSK